MAWTNANLGTDEAAALALDRPMLLGDHVIRGFHGDDAAEKFIWSETLNAGDPDHTATGYPGWRAYDGKADIATKPDSAETLWHFIVGLDDAEIDTIVVCGNNLSTAEEISVGIADNAAFSVRSEEIALWLQNGDGPNRLIAVDLSADGDSNQRISGITYMALRLSYLAPTVPEVTEFWAGHRRQLIYQPDLAWNGAHLVTDVSQDRSRSGSTSRRLRSRAKAVRSATLTTGSADESAVVRDFWDDCEHGSRSFVWIETPNSDPQARIMAPAGDSSDFDQALEGSLLRRVTLGMRELAPHLEEGP
jgi:hypothetical protein